MKARIFVYKGDLNKPFILSAGLLYKDITTQRKTV